MFHNNYILSVLLIVLTIGESCFWSNDAKGGLKCRDGFNIFEGTTTVDFEGRPCKSCSNDTHPFQQLIGIGVYYFCNHTTCPNKTKPYVSCCETPLCNCDVSVCDARRARTDVTLITVGVAIVMAKLGEIL